LYQQIGNNFIQFKQIIAMNQQEFKKLALSKGKKISSISIVKTKTGKNTAIAYNMVVNGKVEGPARKESFKDMSLEEISKKF